MTIFSIDHLYSFSNYASLLVQEKILSSLSAQQIRIVVIASFALGCLAACYLIYQYCFGQRKVVVNDDEVISHAKAGGGKVKKGKIDDQEKPNSVSFDSKKKTNDFASGIMTPKKEQSDDDKKLQK